MTNAKLTVLGLSIHRMSFNTSVLIKWLQAGLAKYVSDSINNTFACDACVKYYSCKTCIPEHQSVNQAQYGGPK